MYVLRLVVSMCFFILDICLPGIGNAQEIPEIACGFPGAPYDGYTKPKKDWYNIKDTVKFDCKEGYERQGPPSNTCNEQGMWQHPDLPVCVQNLAYYRPTNQSSTENDFYSKLAVDGNPSTCAITQFQFKNERNNAWWVHLDKEYVISSIRLKSTVANANIPFNLSIEVLKTSNPGQLKICNLISNKGNTVYDGEVECINKINITGDIVRITDYRNIRGKLTICEVKIFARANYHCGNPGLQPNCMVETYKESGKKKAKYRAKDGFQLTKGDAIHICDDKGKWMGNLPLCIKSRNMKPTASAEKKDNMIIGIAIGVTAASISTIIVIVVIVIIMRKLYRRTPTQTAALSTEHEGVFLRGNNSSCGSGSPTIHANYSDPWDDPSMHTYDYINPGTLKIDKLKKDNSIKFPNPSVDGTGYIINTRRKNCEDLDMTAKETLLDPPIPLRPRYQDPRMLAPPQIDNRANSFNELEVDAYDYSGPEDHSRM